MINKRFKRKGCKIGIIKLAMQKEKPEKRKYGKGNTEKEHH